MPERRLLWIVVLLAFLVSCSSTPSRSGTTASANGATAATANAGIWKPSIGDRWQYQLQNRRAFTDTGGINVGICAQPFAGGACVRPNVFDIDLYGTGGGLATKAADAIHAVEFDVVEAYTSSYRTVGWHISPETQLTFNSALADIAHRYGMSVGLKNDLGQIPELLPKFDFAINEQCFQYHECDNLKLFIQAGKP